jgi:hypothetical protein
VALSYWTTKEILGSRVAPVTSELKQAITVLKNKNIARIEKLVGLQSIRQVLTSVERLVPRPQGFQNTIILDRFQEETVVRKET